MSNQITRESMEFISASNEPKPCLHDLGDCREGEIMDAIHDSDRLEDDINRIQEILDCNEIVEVIPD